MDVPQVTRIHIRSENPSPLGYRRFFENNSLDTGRNRRRGEEEGKLATVGKHGGTCSLKGKRRGAMRI